MEKSEESPNVTGSMDVSSNDDSGSYEYNPGKSNLPNVNITKDQVEQSARQLAAESQLGGGDAENILRGALLAHDPRGFYSLDASDDEKQVGCLPVIPLFANVSWAN